MAAAEVSTPGAWARPGAIGGGHTSFSARHFSSGEGWILRLARPVFRHARIVAQLVLLRAAIFSVSSPVRSGWLRNSDVPLPVVDMAWWKCMRYGTEGRRGSTFEGYRMMSPTLLVAGLGVDRLSFSYVFLDLP